MTETLHKNQNRWAPLTFKKKKTDMEDKLLKSIGGDISGMQSKVAGDLSDFGTGIEPIGSWQLRQIDRAPRLMVSEWGGVRGSKSKEKGNES